MKNTKIQNNSDKKLTTPPPNSIYKRATKLKNLESAQNFISKIISSYQRGEIKATDAKTLSYLVQTFISVYKTNMEFKEIIDFVDYHILALVNQLAVELQTMRDEMSEQFGEDVSNKFWEYFHANIQPKVIIKKQEKIREEIFKKVKERTSFKIGDYYGEPEKIVEAIKRSFWNLPMKHKEEVVTFIKNRCEYE